MAPNSQQKQIPAPCTPKEGRRPPVLRENWRRRPHAPFQHKNLPPVSQKEGRKEPTFIKDMRRPYESHKDERRPPLPLINERLDHWGPLVQTSPQYKSISRKASTMKPPFLRSSCPCFHTTPLSPLFSTALCLWMPRRIQKTNIKSSTVHSFLYTKIEK